MTNQDSDRVAKDLYNEMGKTYEEAYGDNPHQINFVRRSLDRLQPSSSLKVLDIGSGTGKPTCAMIAASGCKLFGIDVSDEMIRIAKEQIPDGTFTNVSMLEYQPPFQFDAAFAIFCMFDFKQDEMEIAVRRWGEWIKPQGWLFVGTIAGDDWEAAGVEFRVYDTDKDAGAAWPRHMGKTAKILNYTKDGWKRLLGAAGFEIVDAEVLPFQPPKEYDNSVEPHYYITCRKTLHS